MTAMKHGHPTSHLSITSGASHRLPAQQTTVRHLLRATGACILWGTVAIAADQTAQPVSSAQSAEAVAQLIALLKGQHIPDGEITLVERRDAPTQEVGNNAPPLTHLPPRTIIKLVLTPAKGSHINVEAWLPDQDKWNGRFVGLGNGGAAGHIGPGGLAGQVSAGYAAATTDMGTAPNADSGIGNKEVWKDFGFRATHLMTLAGKQLTTAFYGKAPDFSYFNGGSTGGQQALQEAQRYPDDYDGIVAYIPAHCRTPLHAYFLWNEQILHACPFTDAQQHNIIRAGNEFVAAKELPQTAGKMVSDPRCTAADIAEVVARARALDPTLTDAHAAAMTKLFDGPRHSVTGERIYNGVPFGSSFGPAHGNLYLFKWVFGATKDLQTINFGADIDTYTAALAPYLNAENPDLDKFAAHGGKLIMLPGSADSVVPYHASLDYYERVAERLGSIDKARAFIRLFIIPGMSHGPGPGLNHLPGGLQLLTDWREKGIAPDKLQCQRLIDGKTELDMPIYPYPQKTTWTKDGGFAPVDGPRGGVERIAERFRPAAAE